jgi:putative ABC transport system permease protein
VSLDPKARRIRREIDHHLEELVDQLVDDGLTPEEARAEARRRFGDRGRIERATRDAVPLRGRGRPRVLDPLWQDLRYAVRQLVARPLMSVLTIATIVVGVAATAVVFSVVHAVVLQPLPFPEPDRLVEVNQTSPQGRPYSVSEPNFVDFAERQQVFEAMAGLGFVTATLEREGDAVAVEAMRVSHGFFSLFGVAPTVGRPFSAGTGAIPLSSVRPCSSTVSRTRSSASRRRTARGRESSCSCRSHPTLSSFGTTSASWPSPASRTAWRSGTRRRS